MALKFEIIGNNLVVTDTADNSVKLERPAADVYAICETDKFKLVTRTDRNDILLTKDYTGLVDSANTGFSKDTFTNFCRHSLGALKQGGFTFVDPSVIPQLSSDQLTDRGVITLSTDGKLKGPGGVGKVGGKWPEYIGSITTRSNLPKGGGQQYMLTFSYFPILQPVKKLWLVYAFVTSAGETMKKIGTTGVNGYADVYAAVLANGKNYAGFDADSLTQRTKRIQYGDYGLIEVNCGNDIIQPGMIDVANYVVQQPHTDTGGTATAANQRMAHLNWDPNDQLYFQSALSGSAQAAWQAAVDAIARPSSDPAGSPLKGEVAIRPWFIAGLTTDDTWFIAGTSREHGADGPDIFNGYGCGEVQTVLGASGAGIINGGIFTEKITDCFLRSGDGYYARGRAARTFAKKLAISYGINDRGSAALPSGSGNELNFANDMRTMVSQLYALIDPTMSMQTILATQAPITGVTWSGTAPTQFQNDARMDGWNRLIRSKGLKTVCNQVGYLEMVPKTNGSNGFGQWRFHPNFRRINAGSFTLSSVAATSSTPAYTNLQGPAGSFSPKDSGPMFISNLGNPAYDSSYSCVAQYIDSQNMRLYRASNSKGGDSDYMGSPLGAWQGSSDGGATTLTFPFTFDAASYPINIQKGYETDDFLHRTKNGLKLALQDNVELGLIPR